MIYRTWLTTVTPGVSLSDTIPNVLTKFFEYRSPRGTAVVIPPAFPLTIELQGGSPIARLPGDTKIYFGLELPSDPDRVHHLARRLFYRPWAELTVAQMGDADFRSQLMVSLGFPLPVGPEEALVILVKGPVACLGASNPGSQMVEIPYEAKDLAELDLLFASRLATMGV